MTFLRPAPEMSRRDWAALALLGAALLGLVAVLSARRTPTWSGATPEERWCRAAYTAARTAADTARVDDLSPELAKGGLLRWKCGALLRPQGGSGVGAGRLAPPAT